MNNQKNYITPEGFEKLKSEYQDLLYKERPKIVEVVAWAASNGDRSENADYIYGKKRLREIDRRLKFLTDRLDIAEVVDPKLVKDEKILFGAKVTITNEEDEQLTYQIVGEDEFDIKLGKISWRSPVAKALLGKKVGDEVVIKKPAGDEVVIVEKVEYL